MTYSVNHPDGPPGSSEGGAPARPGPSAPLDSGPGGETFRRQLVAALDAQAEQQWTPEQIEDVRLTLRIAEAWRRRGVEEFVGWFAKTHPSRILATLRRAANGGRGRYALRALRLLVWITTELRVAVAAALPADALDQPDVLRAQLAEASHTRRRTKAWREGNTTAKRRASEVKSNVDGSQVSSGPSVATPRASSDPRRARTERRDGPRGTVAG